MKKILNKYIKISSLIIIIFASSLMGQSDLSINVKKILRYAPQSEAYLKGYMKPFVTAFGTAVTGGMYHRGNVKNFPGFDVGITMVYIQIPESELMFKTTQNFYVPTVFGENKVPDQNASLPSGTDKKSLMVPQLHINLGLLSGFEVTGRYYDLKTSEFGNVYLLGLAVKYGFGEFIPFFALDLSAQAMYNKFAIDEWLNSGTIGMNLHLSKTLNIIPVELYGGMGFENTTMIIKTASLLGENEPNIGEVSIDGDNTYRFNVGLSWTVSFFNLHADYSIGKYKSTSIGAMIVF